MYKKMLYIFSILELLLLSPGVQSNFRTTCSLSRSSIFSPSVCTENRIITIEATAKLNVATNEKEISIVFNIPENTGNPCVVIWLNAMTQPINSCHDNSPIKVNQYGSDQGTYEVILEDIPFFGLPKTWQVYFNISSSRCRRDKCVLPVNYTIFDNCCSSPSQSNYYSTVFLPDTTTQESSSTTFSPNTTATIFPPNTVSTAFSLDTTTTASHSEPVCVTCLLLLLPLWQLFLCI